MKLRDLLKIVFVDVTLYQTNKKTFELKKVFKGEWFDIPEEYLNKTVLTVLGDPISTGSDIIITIDI